MPTPPMPSSLSTMASKRRKVIPLFAKVIAFLLGFTMAFTRSPMVRLPTTTMTANEMTPVLEGQSQQSSSGGSGDTGTAGSASSHIDTQQHQQQQQQSSPTKMIEVQNTHAKLPSATNLLPRPNPPPYDDSDIIKLSPDLITSENTVVTAYFRVVSKHKPEKYTTWMANMLSLQDAMIIFTSPDLVDQIQQMRQHARNRTVIVPLTLQDLPIGKLHTADFWQTQLDRDPERRIHRSYELFWIWLSKSWWVMEAIRLNIFDSDLFVWSDIGCFRDLRYNNETMILHRDVVPKNEMMQMAHKTPNPPQSETLFNDKYHHKDNFYHSGSQMVAYIETWKTFYRYFLETIDAFLERNMIIVEDQAILQSVCLTYPEICAYIPFKEVPDNNYFGLRYVLHYGGEYNLWRKLE